MPMVIWTGRPAVAVITSSTVTVARPPMSMSMSTVIVLISWGAGVAPARVRNQVASEQSEKTYEEDSSDDDRKLVQHGPIRGGCRFYLDTMGLLSEFRATHPNNSGAIYLPSYADSSHPEISVSRMDFVTSFKLQQLPEFNPWREAITALSPPVDTDKGCLHQIDIFAAVRVQHVHIGPLTCTFGYLCLPVKLPVVDIPPPTCHHPVAHILAPQPSTEHFFSAASRTCNARSTCNRKISGLVRIIECWLERTVRPEARSCQTDHAASAERAETGKHSNRSDCTKKCSFHDSRQLGTRHICLHLSRQTLDYFGPESGEIQPIEYSLCQTGSDPNGLDLGTPDHILGLEGPNHQMTQNWIFIWIGLYQ
ncbi:hypothetical protein DFH09DRAFT_1094345 [Mycena vulgaris]|nr:hypothetical protein DFH09DRAFT_1094345 [Mycena vulgaris]